MVSVSAVTLLVSLADMASAAVVSIGITPGFYSNNSDTINPGDITFDAGQGPPNSVPTPGVSQTFTVGTQPLGTIVTFSGNGYIVNNPPPMDSGGVSAAPFVTNNGVGGTGVGAYDTTNYLSVLGSANGSTSELMSFSQDVRQVGFYWGSIDSSTATWNALEFYNDNQLIATINGSQIPNSNPSGAQGLANTNKYVTFSFTTEQGATIAFDQVKLLADTNSFELDNVSYILAQGGNPAVPEASTWAMMILGFLGVGFLSYRRRSQGVALRFV